MLMLETMILVGDFLDVHAKQELTEFVFQIDGMLGMMYYKILILIF